MGAGDRSDGNKVVTSSRLRMWWLRGARGYTVDTMKREPNENAFGELYYKNHWHLSKHEEK